MATGGHEKAGYSLVNVGDLTLETTDVDPIYRGIVACRDKIIVLDWNQVRLHRLQDGKLLCTHQLESWPRAICLINDMDIGVILDIGQIEIMAVDSRDKMTTITLTRKLKVYRGLDRYDGVVKFKENLVVCGVKWGTACWCVMSLNDRLVEEIHQICKVSKYEYDDYNSYLTIKDNMIYISCFAGYELPDTGVYGFDILNPSQPKYTYIHKDLSVLGPIAINQDGFIFVCNSKYGFDYCIHQLTSQCQLVSIYRQGIPWNLNSLFWDHTHGHLYVTCLWSNVMTIFQPEYKGGRGLIHRLMRSLGLGRSQTKHVKKHSQGEHKAPEVLVSDERKSPVTEKTLTDIEQDVVDQGQSSVETEMPPSVLFPEDSEDDKQASAGPMPSPPTSDTDRFMCIAYLLNDVGSKILRKLFHHMVSPSYTLDQYLANNRSTINSLLKKKVLNPSQMDILFPPNGDDTNLDDYDITLLSALFNNIVPSLGQQEKNLIKSLRDDRNRLYGHTMSCKMNASDFQTCWSNISSTLITLSQQCGDPNFENEILKEIHQTRVPDASYLSILQTWFSRIERVEQRLESNETSPTSETSTWL